MTKQALAREWLWLVVSLLAAVAIVFGWMAPPDPVSGTVVLLLVTVVVYGPFSVGKGSCNFTT